jgi:hypothetical protein
MPQITKGGKYVFAVSIIGLDGTVVVPPEAMREYHFQDGDKVLLMNGSRTTGGFVVTKVDYIEKSALYSLFKNLPLPMPEGEIVKNGGRSFYRTIMRPGGNIVLTPGALPAFGVKPGERLMVFRGSHLGVGFGCRGPVWEKVMTHRELAVFGG